jgi:transcriptional regulator with XRE-family HTH domain
MRKSQHTTEYKRVLVALREARRKSGLKQAEVAEKLGAYANFISKVESGERRVDVVELAALCKVYRVDLVDFLKAARLVKSS